MMKSSDECTHEVYDRKDVRIPNGISYHYYQCRRCGRVEYPLKQAQALLDYSEDHVFMFVEDWILAWMATKVADEYVPIPGITTIQKQMFVLIYEFAQQHDIPSENPGFRAYKFGPYAERIDRALQNLDEMGYVHSKGRLNTNNERFYLTEQGEQRGEEILSRLDIETRNSLTDLKNDLQQFTLDGLETYVYSHYPEYTCESEIFQRVLHRKRT